MNDTLKKTGSVASRLVAAIVLALVASQVSAQFTPGQILTASQLNAALAAKTTNSSAAITGGTITGLSAPLPVASGGTGVISLPSCNSSTSALQSTSTGFVCYTNSATTTGTLAQFAATTSAQLAGVVSDETGSGALVFGTSPTIGTPTINTPTISGGTISNAPISGSTGAFSTLSASGTVSGTGFSTYLASPPCVGCTTPAAGKFTTLQAISAITPSSTAGIVGTTTNDSANTGSVGERLDPSAGSASITSGTATNIVSQSLTAGDWDCEGYVYVLMGSGATGTIFVAGIGTASATLPAAPNITQTSLSIPPSGAMSFPVWASFQLASTTTVYLVGYATFSGGTATTQGHLHCRRPR